MVGNELIDEQIDEDRLEAGTILHGLGDFGGELPHGHSATAGAGLLVDLMFGHLDEDRGKIEELTPLHAGGSDLLEIGATACAVSGAVDAGVVRSVDEAEGAAGMAGLPAWLLAGRRAKALGGTGLWIGRRRLAGIMGVLGGAVFEGTDASFEVVDGGQEALDESDDGIGTFVIDGLDLGSGHGRTSNASKRQEAARAACARSLSWNRSRVPRTTGTDS
jgi:hypothetical protein